jgi:hypothetical protein
MIVAVIAIVFAAAGGAYAASKIGGRDIKANAIKTAKIKDGAVTSAKLAKGAVTADALAPGAIPSTSIGDGSVTTAKLADGSVTTEKLDPSERSEGFTSRHNSQVDLDSGDDTTVMQVALPTPGNYVFTMTASIGPLGGTTPITTCQLLDADNPLAETVVRSDSTTNVLQDAVTLTGVSDGGIVKLSCNPDANAAANHMNVTAVRVANVTTLPDATP